MKEENTPLKEHFKIKKQKTKGRILLLNMKQNIISICLEIFKIAETASKQ